jgi:phosphatidate cytidylyltransferase
MAFNWKTFWTRAFTALIFVAVMLTGLLWNQWAFFILFSVIHFGCWVEYQRLITKIDAAYGSITAFHRYGVMLAGWSFMVYSSELPFHAIGWWFCLLFLFVLPITELLFSKQIELNNIRRSALGLLYISLSWGLLLQLRNFPPYGYLLPLCIIFAIWINDTMAYLVGSLIGRTPLSAISPKKTWEGTLGGIFISIAVMTAIAYWFDLPWRHGAAISTIAAITGTFGDLLESKLKRMAGLKDSGQIMPGHGGFLDRFDSLLIAIPFVWLYVKIFL